MKHRLAAFAAIGLSCILSVSVVRADVPTVNKYIDEAAELIAKGNSYVNDATPKLDLAEASLDDVPAAEKPALQAKIDELKKRIADYKGNEEKRRLDVQLKGLINDLEEDVNNLVMFPSKAEEFNTLINDPKTKLALGDDAIAGYMKQFATMNKVFQSKSLKANLETAAGEVSDLEKKWAEIKPRFANDYARNGALSDMDHLFTEVDKVFANLPADNAEAKPLRARLEAVRADSSATASTAISSSEIERINRYLDDHKKDYEGMDAETTEPTWAEFKKRSKVAEDFNAPKTKAYIQSVGRFLEDLKKEDGYTATKDDPKVKGVVDGLQTKYTAARAKLLKFATKVVDECEKDKIDGESNSEVGMLSVCIDTTFGNEMPDGKALGDRAKKIQQDYLAGSKKEDEQADSLMKTMNAAADKAWPEMEKKFDIAKGFDPNNPGALSGKYIRITGGNRMGWDFSPGDFPYAQTLQGVPVAGEFSSTVQAAMDDAGKKFGAKFTSDDQGDWIVIGKVTTRKGKLTQIVRNSGDVRVDGSRVTVDSTEHHAVDAPIITIVAARAGPVAVAEGQGAVTADGSMAAPVGAASAGHGILGRLWGILMGLLAVVVGAACLMKAKFAPLATNAQAMELSNKVGGENIAYLGLAGVVFGALSLLLSLLALLSSPFHALIGLIAAAAMIIAGGVASRDFLATKGLLPAKAEPILSQYALPAGLVCAALGALGVLTSIF